MLIPFGILSGSVSAAVSLNAGYFGGGFAGFYAVTIDKFQFPSDTRSSLSANAGPIRDYGTMANSGVAGYIGGGFDDTFPSSAITRVSKFAFSDDTKSVLGTGLGATRDKLAGMANSGVAGYFGGGNPNAIPTRQTTVYKFAFPGDTASTLGTGLSAGTSNHAGMANSGVAGYFAGGSTEAGGGTPTAKVDKFAFPGDTASTLGTGLSASTDRVAGMANSGVAGYIGGGSTGSVVATINKFAFPGDTRTTLGTGLSIARQELGAMANSGVAGYFGGGRNSSSTRYSTVDKFAFPSDTRTTLGTGLSNSREGLSGFANSGVL